MKHMQEPTDVEDDCQSFPSVKTNNKELRKSDIESNDEDQAVSFILSFKRYLIQG